MVSLSGKSIDFQAAPYSFASALVNEIQSLLDHASEHRAIVQKIATASNDCSPSWLFVSTYYWSFFCALALLRLGGLAAWHLDKKALQHLFAGSGLAAPGGGTYVLKVGQTLGTAKRNFHLTGQSDKYHETVWKTLASLTEPEIVRVKGLPGASATQISELEMFMCIANDRFAPPNWPSTLRNAINYRPGFSYTAIDGIDSLKINSYLRKMRFKNVAALVSEYQTLSNELPVKCDVTQYIETTAKMVSIKAIVLGEIATSLMSEVISERKIDKRWSAKRGKFLTENLPADTDAIWPFAPAI